MQRFSVESCHAWLQHVRRSRRPRRPPLWSSPVADLCRCVRVCVRACAWACACSTRQEGTLVFHCAVRFLLLRCGLGRSRARLLGLGRLVLRQRASLAQPSPAQPSRCVASPCECECRCGAYGSARAHTLERAEPVCARFRGRIRRADCAAIGGYHIAVWATGREGAYMQAVCGVQCTERAGPAPTNVLQPSIPIRSLGSTP